MPHQVRLILIEERISMIGEVDNKGILLAVAPYDLVDDVVGVEQTISIGCYDLILGFALAHR